MARGLVGRRLPSPESSSPPSKPAPTSAPRGGGEEISDPNFYAVPLEGVDVNVLVHDFSQQVTVDQTYCNTEDYPIEVKYVFPLDNGGAIVRFEAKFDSETITGVVKEKAAAKKEYEAAVAESKQAALLEQDSSNVFTCNVGNLKANERCTISITYVGELKMRAGVTNFVLPMVVAPPYVPRGTRAPAGAGAARAPATAIPYRLALNIDLWMPSTIRSATSGTHTIETERKSDNNWTVRLAEGSTSMDKDLDLQIEQESPYGSRAVIERFGSATPGAGWGAKSMAMQATFCERNLEVKEVMAGDLFCEIIFLVDVSGSMAGSAMENTKACLQIFLRSMPERAKFNIYAFESRFKTLFTESKDYDDDSLAAASAFVAGLRASGGTELLPPLEQIFRTAPLDGFPRQVFLLTDGQVSNTAAVVSLTAQNADGARVFTFGLGSSVDRKLVEGIATAGGGQAEFVIESAKIAAHVSAQLARALQPAISSISVDWGQGFREAEAEPGSTSAAASEEKKTEGALTNAHIRQCPARLPPIYPGSRYFLYGLVDTDRLAFAETFEIKIKAHFSNGGERVISIPVVTGKNSRVGSMIHKLAARARIAELEKKGTSDAMAKGEILYLSLKYQLSSPLTSFVAVSSRAPTEALPLPVRRDVVLAAPVSLDEDDEADGFAGYGAGAPTRKSKKISSSSASSSSSPSSSARSLSARRSSPTASPVAPSRFLADTSSKGGPSPGSKVIQLEAQAESLSRSSVEFKKSSSTSSSGSSSGGGFMSRLFGSKQKSAAPAPPPASAPSSSSASAGAAPPSRPGAIGGGGGGGGGAADGAVMRSRGSAAPKMSAAPPQKAAEKREKSSVAAAPSRSSLPITASPSMAESQSVSLSAAAPSASIAMFADSLDASDSDHDESEKEEESLSVSATTSFAMAAPMSAPPPPPPPPSAFASSSPAPPPPPPSAASSPPPPRAPSASAGPPPPAPSRSASSASYASSPFAPPSAPSSVSASASASASARPSPPPVAAASPYLGVIQSQKSDGSWLLDVIVSRGALSKTTESLRSTWATYFETWSKAQGDEAKLELKENASAHATELAGVLGTVIALAILTRQHAAKQVEWMILAEKARAYLVKRLNRILSATSGSIDWETRLDSLVAGFAAAASL